MAAWQGPCLWAYNDATFAEQDFDNLCTVGARRKKGARIGRFGVGFNSVYNVTDLPSVVSGDVALFFDPHVTERQACRAERRVLELCSFAL